MATCRFLKIRYKICGRVVMKSQKNISTLLGLSQYALAMLLNVRRSQFSMYELGLRPLPPAASLQLSEMVLLYLEDDPLPLPKELQQEEEKYKASVKKQLDENAHQQHLLSQKIEDAETTYNAKLKTLRFLQKLNLKHGKSKSGENTLPQVLENKATSSLKKEGWRQIRQYQMKLELLKYEEKLLREELGEKP